MTRDEVGGKETAPLALHPAFPLSPFPPRAILDRSNGINDQFTRSQIALGVVILLILLIVVGKFVNLAP